MQSPAPAQPRSLILHRDPDCARDDQLPPASHPNPHLSLTEAQMATTRRSVPPLPISRPRRPHHPIVPARLVVSPSTPVIAVSEPHRPSIPRPHTHRLAQSGTIGGSARQPSEGPHPAVAPPRPAPARAWRDLHGQRIALSPPRGSQGRPLARPTPPRSASDKLAGRLGAHPHARPRPAPATHRHRVSRCAPTRDAPADSPAQPISRAPRVPLRACSPLTPPPRRAAIALPARDARLPLPRAARLKFRSPSHPGAPAAHPAGPATHIPTALRAARSPASARGPIALCPCLHPDAPPAVARPPPPPRTHVQRRRRPPRSDAQRSITLAPSRPDGVAI
ncbi:hypothetical protein OBBRIDRAFT_836492 [Obba rivulosa]|uniref:Uncharacterized protein n=1 Tax=Obba rivulosa TaxID=1052685 RepID=A0A8E2AQ36_9APHY|nr:hypothetical protein OBBRIDRAFT_836492 [Obba rivulosa]